jgi:hypothetical protein
MISVTGRAGQIGALGACARANAGASGAIAVPIRNERRAIMGMVPRLWPLRGDVFAV